MTIIIRTLTACVLALVADSTTAQNASLIDPAIAAFIEPKDIKWVPNAAGTVEFAVLYGDPSKPGLYVVRNKWKAGNMSRPHFHPNDRLIVVLEGTWWVGTGDVFDPNKTVPMGPGTHVLHYGGKIYYDGAKDGDTIIQIHGIGPETSTPAERKP